ncbi:MAG TPA: benzoyl-CoA reductase subunit C [Planctomycetes bacterium]|nr:benzoyl-CoA reductase subunit C [Planctomycetota bacterium]
MTTNTGRSLEDILEFAETLYHDAALSSVRDWKKTHPGRIAVGSMPVWAPRELIHAAGGLPVSVMGGGDDVEIIKGDAYFQSYICHIPRSTIEMGLNGSLDVLDGMIFPSICDVIRNLSGMWKLLFPEKPAWYLDMPQSFDEIGRSFFRGELLRIGKEMGELAGHEITAEALKESIAVFDRNRALLERLQEHRLNRPWMFPISEVWSVIKAGGFIPIEEHNDLIEEYIAAAEASGRPPIDNARVILVGSFCERPPLNLLRTLERSGCYVVDDDLSLGFRLIRGSVGAEGDPYQALADAFVERSREAAFLYREGEKGKELVARARAAHAEGVLFCAPSFCDPALLDQPMLVEAVEKAGLPWTAFKYAENTGQFQVIREQAGTFADSIKLWSVA